jgi:outer membrane protein TolC
MKRAIGCLSLAVLAACSFEPVRAPDLPTAEQYTSTPITQTAAAPGVPGGNAQRFVASQDIPAQWWELFRSPALDRLVRDALDNSPTLGQAAARLRQAEEDLSARSGATHWPRVDAKLSAYRADTNSDVLGIPALSSALPLNLYLASVSVSYTFDFFGGTRHELDALRAETD